MIINLSINKPTISQIELTNYCNLKCPMCPRTEYMTRDVEFMSVDLFNKIINDLNLCNPRNGGTEINLHHFGESLFHPQLKEILDICNKNKIGTLIGSNGTSLTKEKRKDIIGRLGRLWISFDTINKEKYEEMRKGASFEKVVKNIENLMKEKGNKRPYVILSTLIHENKKEYKDFWEKRGVKKFIFKDMHNWRNQKKIKEYTGLEFEISSNPCLYLINHCCILVDGSVVPCCMDFNGELVLGNIKEKTLEDIWTGKEYNRVRSIHFLLKGKKYMKLCSECSRYPQRV